MVISPSLCLEILSVWFFIKIINLVVGYLSLGSLSWRETNSILVIFVVINGNDNDNDNDNASWIFV